MDIFAINLPHASPILIYTMFQNFLEPHLLQEALASPPLSSCLCPGLTALMLLLLSHSLGRSHWPVPLERKPFIIPAQGTMSEYAVLSLYVS